MAKSSDTTNPTDERNTALEIVSDMETTIIALRCYLGVIDELAEPFKEKTASGREQSIDWTLGDALKSAETLRDQRLRLLDAIHREGTPGTPSTPHSITARQADGCKQWPAIYARWLKLQAAWADSEAAEDVSDEVGARLLDEESDLVREVARTSPALPWQAAQKVGVLERYMERSSWSDRRDEVLLASIKRDLEAMS